MKIARTLSVAIVVPMASAFSIHSHRHAGGRAILHQSKSLTTRFMANDDGSQQPPLIKSGRKEIAYDEATGRFFETDIDESECIPDEEFCITDKGTGQLIRLTTEEKERIFLDSLQVSAAQTVMTGVMPCLPIVLAWIFGTWTDR